jgi:hypothetical protein
MFTRRALLTTAVLGALVSACGYVSSGIWENDPDNWGRAFGSKPFDHARAVHSLYWRSPHFTYEAAYWFEFEPSADFEREIFAQNEFVRLESDYAPQRRREFQGKSLKWFAPNRGDDAYEIWGWREKERSPEFRILIDRETRAIFMADMHL